MSSNPTPDAAAIWITEYLTKRLDIPASEMKADVLFSEFGVDSTFAVVMSGDISDWTGREMPPNLLYEYPTIEQLARHIASAK